ncbi:S-adenosyl-L-methionine-dependent methyltransferase [Aspergillus bertholletiae]|uniref:S-adenosyl-L-methionine-dependent methyltransferase n=1 Tax=Aspergillus bertholletiae TaxID=1226010 RepID=A0A5N7BE73_9EURO|nr:S-adenosyl-L-methionine-dependent methyltransferase [Aspergillus bertholletiae]
MSAHKVNLIQSNRTDLYQEKVVEAYDDPPEIWKKVLGNEGLGFQFGLFDAAELAQGPKPGPVGPSELRHFDRQLELAGLSGPGRPRLNRILDLGCGWGAITEHLAKRFPECPCIDAINISQSQLDYCVKSLPADLSARVNLYKCNGQDVDLIPDPAIPYDLVVARGAYTHFLPQVFEDSVSRVVQRLAPNGLFITSDLLYRVDSLENYESYIPDTVDRFASGNRKTVDYYVGVLKKNGLAFHDFRLLPSAAEQVHWFRTVQLNIEQNFPPDVDGPIQELHDVTRNCAHIVAEDKVGVHSVIAVHDTARGASTL